MESMPSAPVEAARDGVATEACGAAQATEIVASRISRAYRRKSEGMVPQGGTDDTPSGRDSSRRPLLRGVAGDQGDVRLDHQLGDRA